ncbi:conserved hypothetical protein [Thioalkalivibrio sp. K90mix]|uniref:DUF5362 family protein n=2 Tax=Thioalkalivibrio TaxID=106633 RepID=UPI000195A5BF|nr:MULTISPECIES: DUF5362 family protein [unclassified Thioalkalivibrio]ADC70653.1 conserved hypothetical protein [Thioalkalivibrio sp. K90mix]
MEAESTGNPQLRELIEPLVRGKFWMQLIGIMLVISGVLTALSIVGILIAWIPIWAGVVLMQAAGASQRAFDSADPLEIKYALSRLRIYFTIFGVLLLIYLALMIVGMLFGIGAGMMGLGAMGEHMQ